MANTPSALRVLIVEDDWFTAQETSALFRSAGCLVIGPVSTIAETRGLLATFIVDVALLDIELVGETAFELARRLQFQGIPIVFHSSRNTNDRPADLIDVPFSQKPNDPVVVIQASWVFSKRSKT